MPRQTGVASDLFEALVEYSSDAIVLLDERGIIRFASRSSERVLGYTANERMNQSAFDLVHDDDVPKVREALARAAAEPGAPFTQQFRVHHKDGTWRHIEAVAVNRLSEPAVGGIVVNYRDVSERMRAAEALRTSDERLRHLFETAPDIIYYCDPAGRFTYVNPTASRVMKYPESEIVGRHFITLIRPDYQAAAGEFYRRQLEAKTPNSYFEFPAITKDDQTIWVGQHVQLVFDRGEIVGVQAICRDISKQKDAEDRLRRSEARYRSLIQGAAYGLYRAAMDGRILDANPAFAHMLGYESVDAVKAVNMASLCVTPDEREALLAECRQSGSQTLSRDVVWRKKDGTPITVRVTARAVDFVELEGESGTTVEGIAEDITEKRELEEQLRQSQKMEAVGRLARGIAHDFNNVLAAILGCADLMLIRLDPNDPSYADAAEIFKAAERGAALTRRLLAFSRRQAVEPQVLDVHEVLRGFDTMLQRIAGKITLRLHTPGNAPKVELEPGQLEQIVMNLVLNARDATPADGAIDVYADTVEIDGRGSAGLPPGRYARIAVHDTGPGIDPSLRRLVFEPFFTTKGPSKGTGLGLSIVYGIAKEARGAASFSSPEGRGTTFEVLLPLVEARDSASPP